MLGIDFLGNCSSKFRNPELGLNRKRAAVSKLLLLSGCFAMSAMAQNVSFWPPTAVPRVPVVTNDTAAVTLGLKFYSDVPGSIKAVRFYKGSGNGGTHIGDLWSSSGAKLAEVTFSSETATGWQQANFSSPVHINAKTNYTISYLAPQGRYADDENYAWSSLTGGVLHPANSTAGTYAYGSSAAYPNSTWHASNYWVDVVFVADASSGSGTGTYTLSGNVSGTSATLTLSGASSGSTTTDASGNYSFSNLPNGSYLVAPSKSGYNFNPPSASATINGATVSGVNFTGTAVTATSHSVTLSWTASASPNITGYRVYRSNVSGGSYALLNTSLVSGTSYTDTSVTAGQTYYYCVTAVDSSSAESADSNEAQAVVPTP